MSNSTQTDLSLFANLPFSLIQTILLYDSHYIIRNGKVLIINKLLTTDPRYAKLRSIPTKEMIDNITILNLYINPEKDYYIVYTDYSGYPAIQIQVLGYPEFSNNTVLLDAVEHIIT